MKWIDTLFAWALVLLGSSHFLAAYVPKLSVLRGPWEGGAVAAIVTWADECRSFAAQERPLSALEHRCGHGSDRRALHESALPVPGQRAASTGGTGRGSARSGGTVLCRGRLSRGLHGSRFRPGAQFALRVQRAQAVRPSRA